MGKSKKSSMVRGTVALFAFLLYHLVVGNVYLNLEVSPLRLQYDLEGCQLASNCNLRFKEQLSPVLVNTSSNGSYGVPLTYDLRTSKGAYSKGAISCSWKAHNGSVIALYADFAFDQHNSLSQKPFQSCESPDLHCHHYSYSPDGELVLQFAWSQRK